MSDPFSLWTGRIVLLGLFLIFLAHFGKFVWGEVWPVIEPACNRLATFFARSRTTRVHKEDSTSV